MTENGKRELNTHMITVSEKECRSGHKTSCSCSLYGLVWGFLSDEVGSIVSGGELNTLVRNIRLALCQLVSQF